jgi:hypothetical protein
MHSHERLCQDGAFLFGRPRRGSLGACEYQGTHLNENTSFKLVAKDKRLSALLGGFVPGC